MSIYRLNEQEIKRAQAIEESYKKLIAEVEAKIAELKPEEPAPEDPKNFDRWLESGSPEWRKARERKFELIRAQGESLRTYMQSVFDAHFKKISRSTKSILKSAYQEIDEYIEYTYKQYEKIVKTGIDEDGKQVISFNARDVRALDGGKRFLLDSERVIEDLSSVVSRHLQALSDDAESTRLINDYIVKAVANSKYTTADEGERLETVYVNPDLPAIEETTRESFLATRPKDYVTTVDRITQKLFSNDLVKPADADPDALYDVRLDAKGKVLARVAIDYNDLLSRGTIVEIPELHDRDYNVHDAIITLISAGNRVMSYDMIYRAMTGKVTGQIKVPDEALSIINEALDKFRGTFKLEYTYKDSDGSDVVETYDEPLVTFQRLTKKTKINGKVVKGGIRLSDDIKLDPPLLRWARSNGNEIDTRDITLLDVEGLNNGDESFTIKMCLYRRLIKMRNEFDNKKHGRHELDERKSTIRYDYVYEALGLADPDANKRRLVKDKIDRCMKYWKEKGFVADYEHKRDRKTGNNFYAVRAYFMPTLN